jgi:tetratricopeptide (TPR) repeat protein
MTRRLPVIALAFTLLMVALRVRAEDILYEDERMAEAGSLLSDREQYPRAIALYRQVLEEFPSNSTARLWLARVLSWQGDNEQAIAEYDLLLQLDPPPEGLDVERAEVLSWAGRYDEAQAAFDQILIERPDDRRAIVGKARAYGWSGRRAEAARSYERALVLADDPDTRKELGDLRSGLGGGGDARGLHYFDSDGYSRTTVLSTVGADLDFATRMIGEVAFSRAGRDQPDPQLPFGTPLYSNGVSVLGGLERRVTSDFVLSAQGGYAWWEKAPGQWLARAKGEYSLPTNTSFALQVDHGGFVTWSDSYAALSTGLSATNLRGTVWQGLHERWGVFGYAETAFVSDGNQRIAVGASTDYQPFSSVDFVVGLGADYLTYTDRTDLYYDPTIDVGATTLARLDQPLVGWLSLFAEAGVGAGYAEEGGLAGYGLTYNVGGGLLVRRGGLELTVHGGRSQSQRASIYTAHTFGASITLVF